MITATHVASSTGPCGLPHAVAVSPYVVAEEGYCLAVRALESKEGYNQIEGADGVFRTIVEGDVLLGSLGERQALKGFSGRIPRQIAPGDTVIVNVKVVEGERTRVQAYEGVCIGRSGGGLNESFTVRKISYGEGVERVFPVMSPMIDSIKVVRRGKVRRAKLYYLRQLRGKSARIAEKQDRATAVGE